ncbi:MAG: superoxide dismutase [Methylococcaceae bacterium]|nr:superoxide dismutase [Methylococcaceae bacterium]
MTQLSRRSFLTLAGAAAAGYFVGAPRLAMAVEPFVLPPLPYGDADLAPVISQETIGFHYAKHHQTYVNNLNALVAKPENADYAELGLEEIVRATAHRRSLIALFNNAAQAWNHEFYWNSLTPKGGDNQKPTGMLLEKLEAAFGSYEGFKVKFRDAAVGQFGSGWAWLVCERGELKIVTTSNAGNPLTADPRYFLGKDRKRHYRHGPIPLLTIDVWEHAYYIDYRNRRKDHVDAVINSLLNWNQALDRLAAVS